MRVSVVVPVYDHAAFVEAALRSVHAQAWDDLELIAIDDCSSDGSPEIMESLGRDPAFRSRFSRLMTERNQKNLGAAATIERGLAMATGDVLAILNSDDLYAPARLQRCVAALDDRHQLAFTGVRCIDTKGAYDHSTDGERLSGLPRSCTRFPTVGSAFLGQNRAVTTGNLVFTRALHAATGGFRDLALCHDWDFVLAAILATEPRLVDDALYFYRLHGGNSFSALAGAAEVEGERCLGRFFERVRMGAARNPALGVLVETPTVWDSLIEHAGPGVAKIARHVELHAARSRRFVPPAAPEPTATEAMLAEIARKLDPKRDTVLLITPHAERSGSAILALNLGFHLRQRCNMVLLALAGGGLLPTLQTAFGNVIVPDRERMAEAARLTALVRAVIDRLPIAYVVANGPLPWMVRAEVARRFVGTVVLAHRPEDVEPGPDFIATLASHRGAATTGSVLSRWQPFGPSDISMARSREEMRDELARLRKAALPSIADGTAFIAIGYGPIDGSAAVERFIACAAAFVADEPEPSARFVWIGTGRAAGQHSADRHFADATAAAAAPSLKGSVRLVRETASLEAALQLAHCVIVTAPDGVPLPMLDGMARGIPTIRMVGSAGADWLGEEAGGLVPDAAAAATLLREIADAGGRRHPLGATQRGVVQAAFSMARYAEAVDETGRAALDVARRRRDDAETLIGHEAFDAGFHLPPSVRPNPRPEVVHAFIHRDGAAAGERRAIPGFHPGIYQAAHAEAVAGGNPTAEFVRRGEPAGPWKQEVIAPTLQAPRPFPVAVGAVALHMHVFHVDGIADMLRRLPSPTNFPIDLLVSTDSPSKAREIEAIAAGFGHADVGIGVMVNRGRNLGPLLTGFAPGLCRRYAVIGHVHSKKSPHLSADQGDGWRTFLLEHVLGGFAPMVPTILERMAEDPTLGLVYPADPHVFGWNWHDPDEPAASPPPDIPFGAESNRTIADRLAPRLGLGRLPDHIDFPAGAMFWARTDALAPLFDLGLQWEDYPPEPLPHDGTMLHAIERLLPLVVQSRGYRSAVTHIPGIGR